MVTKYSGYIHTPATRATGYVEDLNGSVVLASEYDALEARIAELEEELDAAVEFAHTAEQAFCAANTELARVKAESLRVVKCGTVCELQDCMTEYCFIEGKDRLNVASEFAKQHYATMRVQPVRLERWEDEG